MPRFIVHYKHGNEHEDTVLIDYSDPDWNGSDEVDTAFVEKIAKQDADDGIPMECEHGYSEGCPDCDVPSHFPAVLGEGLSGRLTEIAEGEEA